MVRTIPSTRATWGGGLDDEQYLGEIRARWEAVRDTGIEIATGPDGHAKLLVRHGASQAELRVTRDRDPASEGDVLFVGHALGTLVVAADADRTMRRVGHLLFKRSPASSRGDHVKRQWGRRPAAGYASGRYRTPARSAGWTAAGEIISRGSLRGRTTPARACRSWSQLV